MKRLKKSTAVIFSMLLLGSASTNAAMVSSGIGSTGWSLNYDNTQVTSFAFSPGASPSATGARNEGSLSLNLTWATSAPITLSFVENAAATAAQADLFGLRITLNENITNSSGAAFTGLDFMLVDTTPVSPQNSTAHPGRAHFHNDTTSLGTFTAPGLPAGSAPFSFSATGSSLVSGASAAWTGIGIHEWDIAGLARTFQLVETPVVASTGGGTAVPEPSSYALLAAGLLGLGMAMRRRKT